MAGFREEIERRPLMRERTGLLALTSYLGIFSEPLARTDKSASKSSIGERDIHVSFDVMICRR